MLRGFAQYCAEHKQKSPSMDGDFALTPNRLSGWLVFAAEQT
jgi:hypothetical protein